MMERPDDNESLPSMSGRAELRAVRRTVAQGEPRHADSGPQPAFSRSAHVLAVDDDPAMGAMVAHYLVDQNLRVSAAADSHEMQRVPAPAGENVPLTKGEFAVLTVFLQSPQHGLTREHLLAASRVHDNEVFDRSIDVQILRLRRKLEADPSAPSLIKTERGVGYVFSSL